MNAGIFGPLLHQCRAVASDGVELLGLASMGKSNNVIIFIHGQYDNAYQQPVNQLLMSHASELGFSLILANNRGQDYYSYQRILKDSEAASSWSLFGSAFELVNESNLDIDAWLEMARAVYGDEARVFLVGHSHGSIKIARYVRTSHSRTQSLSGVVLLSPSDDIEAQRQHLEGRYQEALEFAASLVETESGNTWMPAWAHASPMSAATYQEAFGDNSSLNLFRFQQPQESEFCTHPMPWEVPTLVVFGDNDAATAGVASDEALRSIENDLLHSPNVNVATVPGADHHYRGKEKQLVDLVVEWVASN